MRSTLPTTCCAVRRRIWWATCFALDVAERLETQERTNRGLMYRIFAEIADPPDETGSVALMRSTLWKRLRITPNEITRRFKLAVRIRPRRSLTGPTLTPELPELAAAVEAGAVGDDHIRSVCRAIDVLPGSVSPVDVEAAERTLVRHAARRRRRDRRETWSTHRRLPQSRRPVQRRGPCPPARVAPRPPGARRDVAAVRIARPADAAPTSRRSRPRCDRAVTSRTTTPIRATTAPPPSAATTR